MSDIKVEVRSPSGNMGASLPESFEKRAGELSDAIGRVANRLRSDLDAKLTSPAASQWQLDEVALTFSVDLEVESGVIIARTAVSGGFQAELTWTRRSASG
ncbi:MAG: hypothetical protein M3203_10875 [Actinomycetota bacterium]|nr:hypothetical protein [Actinomycetota bacterium]